MQPVVLIGRSTQLNCEKALQICTFKVENDSNVTMWWSLTPYSPSRYFIPLPLVFSYAPSTKPLRSIVTFHQIATINWSGALPQKSLKVSINTSFQTLTNERFCKGNAITNLQHGIRNAVHYQCTTRSATYPFTKVRQRYVLTRTHTLLRPFR